jgi:hypothetical protein
MAEILHHDLLTGFWTSEPRDMLETAVMGALHELTPDKLVIEL